jgi:hypothetical protein
MNCSKIAYLVGVIVTGAAVVAVAQEKGPTSPPTEESGAKTESPSPSTNEKPSGVDEAKKHQAKQHETKKNAPGEHASNGQNTPNKTVSDPVGAKAFVEVARVLQSPRCMNCHPDGDRPLQTDASRPHRMNVSRASEEAGMECATCHREQNSEALGVQGGPPGAPNWHLPPRETPMVFEGLTTQELCEQLKTPDENGGKSLADLLHHISEDALVLWGWNPGGDRTKPPLTHAEFVKHFETWVKSGGACPTAHRSGERSKSLESEFSRSLPDSTLPYSVDRLWGAGCCGPVLGTGMGRKSTTNHLSYGDLLSSSEREFRRHRHRQRELGKDLVSRR